MPEHLITLADIIEQHGQPSEGMGGANAVAVCRMARESHKEALTALLDGPRREQRELTASESRAFDTHQSQIRQLDAATELYNQRERRAAEVYAEYGQTGRWSVTGEPATYRRADPTGPSWARDMAAVAMRADPEAAQRLQRNTREVALETRALSTTDGTGGEFVPPLWLVSEYVALARAGRPTANLVRPAPLPPGTDTINLPRIATGTTTAEQATQNTPVSNTDATTNAVTASVATIAGQQVISQQLIDQSPVNMDEVLLSDLLADLAVKIDQFVISNNAANKRGLLNVPGLNTIVYTDTTPTVGELWPKLADATRQVFEGRFLPADVMVMHPRRWAWMTAAVDSQNRPLVLPVGNAPMNVIATSVGSVQPDGLVGYCQGLPVFVDANMPTNLGTGTNEDRIIIMRGADTILYEGVPRAEAFREPKADQLSVLLRVYNYVALHSERYPKSISVVSGTGLITPSF